jgi:hypothetical protein
MAGTQAGGQVKFRKRDWLGGAGVALALAASPLMFVSHAAYLALWYLGWTLAGIWLVLDIRAGDRNT